MFSKTGPIPVCDKSFDKTPLSSLLSGCLNSCGINSKHSDILKKKGGGTYEKLSPNYMSHAMMTPQVFVIRVLKQYWL